MNRKPVRKRGPKREFGSSGPNIIRGARNNDLEEVKAALNQNWTNITQKDVSNGMTALHYAAALGNYNMAQFLLQRKGIELRAEDRFGRDALDVAIDCGNQRIVEAVFQELAKQAIT